MNGFGQVTIYISKIYITEKKYLRTPDLANITENIALLEKNLEI